MVGAFSSGSANVTTSGGNTTLAINDPVTIVPQNEDPVNMPGGFTFNTIYFVKSVAGSTITIGHTRVVGRSPAPALQQARWRFAALSHRQRSVPSTM